MKYHKYYNSKSFVLPFSPAQICPNNNTLVNTQKQLLREFKIDEFLKQATCLQLLCAGEKLNVFSSSKVVLIRYNESVRNLLGVKTILMKF